MHRGGSEPGGGVGQIGGLLRISGAVAWRIAAAAVTGHLGHAELGLAETNEPAGLLHEVCRRQGAGALRHPTLQEAAGSSSAAAPRQQRSAPEAVPLTSMPLQRPLKGSTALASASTGGSGCRAPSSAHPACTYSAAAAHKNADSTVKPAQRCSPPGAASPSSSAGRLASQLAAAVSPC